MTDPIKTLRDALEPFAKHNSSGETVTVTLRTADVARARAALAATEEQFADLVTHGVAVSQGGRRIDPADFWKSPLPPLDRIAETGHD